MFGIHVLLNLNDFQLMKNEILVNIVYIIICLCQVPSISDNEFPFQESSVSIVVFNIRKFFWY